MDHLWRLGEIVARSVLPSNLLPASSGPQELVHRSNRTRYGDCGSLDSVKPFPPLPRELVLRILSLTLPPPAYSTSSRRRRLLLDFSAFDRDCARWASAELWRHVHLPTPRTAKLFFAQLDTTARSRSISSLRIGQDVDETSMFQEDWLYADVGTFVEQVLSVCPDIEELWIAGAKDLRLGSLSGGSNLRKLYLLESRIVPSNGFHLPRLRLLHIKAVICTGSTLEDLLSPSAIPKLECLDFFSVHQSLVSPRQQQPRLDAAVDTAGPNLQQLNDMFAHLQTRHDPSPRDGPPYRDIASRIAHLSLGPYATRTLPLSALPLFDSLVTLSIPIGLFLSPSLVVDELAPSIRAIRITSEMTRSDERELNQDDVLRRNQWDLARRKGMDSLERFTRERGRASLIVDDTESDSAAWAEQSLQGITSLSLRLARGDEEPASTSGTSTRDVVECSWTTESATKGERDGPWDLGPERWREGQ